jgi:hypothetical protein
MLEGWCQHIQMYKNDTLHYYTHVLCRHTMTLLA